MTDRQEIRAFDFHCHVDLHADPAGTIAACSRERVVVLAVTTTPKAWPHNRSWTAGQRYVYAAPGLHPELVGERHSELALLEDYIGESRFVGEVGLDGSPQHRQSATQQLEVFTRALRRAEALGGRVVSIHSRRAAADVIRTIQDNTKPDRTLCILHWFSGSQRDMREAVTAGCFFSVNHEMLRSPSGQAIARNIPKDRLLTETDAPFTVFDKRNATPTDVVHTVKGLAEVRVMPKQEMGAQLMANALRVFAHAGVAVGPGC